jgi:type 1 glutamine amidotransferase
MNRKGILSIVLIALAGWSLISAKKKPFETLVILSKAKDHIKMMECARPFLEKMGRENNFNVTVSDDTSLVNDENLKKYKVFVMLQEAPFDMSTKQQDALQRFIEKGNGWVGIHAAGLAGSSFLKPTRRYWQWFEDFLGGVSYSPHPKFQQGTVVIEDHKHPVTKGLPDRFEIGDEWYEFDKSPRGNVHVLAVADESTYTQKKPMGDHPIIWTNEHFRRMVYIAIGHDASMCTDPNFELLVRNSIIWAAN